MIRTATGRGLVALVAVGAALGPTAAAGASQTARSHSIVLLHNRFHPPKLVIHRGDTVTWLWRDGKTLHNVVSSSFRGLESPKASGSFTKRFTHSGNYSYFCTIHAGMTGTIVVH